MPKLKHLTAKEREKLLKKAMLPSSDELGEEEKQSSSSAITLKIKVDTSELDKAIDKAKELRDILQSISFYGDYSTYRGKPHKWQKGVRACIFTRR